MDVYGFFLLPLTLPTTTANRRTLLTGIHVYSLGIVGFTEQRTAFTRAQSAIFQIRGFNLREQRVLKITYSLS